MSQRIVVGLNPGTNPADIAEELRHEGVEVRDPSPQSPLVLVATLPPTLDPQEFATKVRGLQGVRYVEAEVFRGIE